MAVSTTNARYSIVHKQHGAPVDLPNDLWLNIFAMLSTSDRRLVLPLVCKQWHSLCCSTEIWRETGIDLSKAVVTTRSREQKKALVQRFFAKRSCGIRQLDVGLCLENADIVHDLLIQLKGSARLQKLTVNVKRSASSRYDLSLEEEAGQLLTAAISELSSLVSLTCCNFQMLLDPGARFFQSLRSLTSLHLTCLLLPDDERRRGYLPVDMSCLTSLQHLEIGAVETITEKFLTLVVDPWLNNLVNLSCLELGDEPFSKLEWTGLTRLHTFKIHDEIDTQSVVSWGLQKLPSLRSLFLWCEDIPEQLTVLTGLTELEFLGQRRSWQNDDVLGRVLRSCQPLRLALLVSFGYIPETLRTYSGLQYLEINDEILQTIPDGPYMSTLCYLDLWAVCQLSEIAQAVLFAPHLRDVLLPQKFGACGVLRLQDGNGRNLLAAGHEARLKAVSDLRQKLLDNKEGYVPWDDQMI